MVIARVVSPRHCPSLRLSTASSRCTTARRPLSTCGATWRHSATRFYVHNVVFKRLECLVNGDLSLIKLGFASSSSGIQVWLQLSRVERVTVTDDGGNTVAMVRHPNGLLLREGFAQTDFDSIASLPLRHDDVFLCSYPRTGTHWLCEQLRMLLAGTTDVGSADKESAMLELHFRYDPATLPSPRLLNTHVTYEHLPRGVRQMRQKIVLLYRNPKDQVASFYNYIKTFPPTESQYAGQFSQYLQLWKKGEVDWGSYADYLRDWERVMAADPSLPVHVVSYEALQQRPLEELAKLSEFLAVDRDEAFLRSVWKACSKDQMLTRKAQFWTEVNPNTWLLHSHYRRGPPDAWKRLFTVQESEDFDDFWAEKTAGFKVFNFS